MKFKRFILFAILGLALMAFISAQFNDETIPQTVDIDGGWDKFSD